ncbi:MAG TPA: glyoxalase/bleomycin resistance/extradiol dioxygenase family protein [Actinomycetes bacterium]|nr:glyoxalase/bleomycin resistance/extradiol dioxygenase family protein [Actinomycetes bacterium]
MSTSIFVNLPVRDLDRSVAFFAKLGYGFDPQFTNKDAACLVVDESINVMLLREDFFATFTPKKVADSTGSTETIIALSAESKQRVDELVNAALGAGAVRYKEPVQEGPMYGWGFQDLDGHLWELIYMEPRPGEADSSTSGGDDPGRS